MWIVLLCMHPSAQILNMQISVATAIAGVFAIFASDVSGLAWAQSPGLGFQNREPGPN